MSATSGWVVKVTHIQGTYASNYFPRSSHYKKDALRIAEEARLQGCRGISVEKKK